MAIKPPACLHFNVPVIIFEIIISGTIQVFLQYFASWSSGFNGSTSMSHWLIKLFLYLNRKLNIIE